MGHGSWMIMGTHMTRLIHGGQGEVSSCLEIASSNLLAILCLILILS